MALACAGVSHKLSGFDHKSENLVTLTSRCRRIAVRNVVWTHPISRKESTGDLRKRFGEGAILPIQCSCKLFTALNLRCHDAVVIAILD